MQKVFGIFGVGWGGDMVPLLQVSVHIHLFRGGDDPGVIVCVGSTGTGKSSTIARVTGAEVKSGAGKDHT